MSDLFLGLDSSTQGLTALIIDGKLIVSRHSLNYDRDLPHYNTQNGILVLDDGRTVHSNPLMWAEALDLLFGRLNETSIPLDKIKAISGSGQQHGTVYLNGKFKKILSTLNPYEHLVYQLKGCFTRKTSPVWMDSSTSQQCKEIRKTLGGMKKTIRITGSNTFERFSGPQIRKFWQEEPEAYERTTIIHLVSSYMASLLLGVNAPIDHGDGAGMNLMNIESKGWDERAIRATAPDLEHKLPELVDPRTIIGTLSPYFVKKHGFGPETKLIAWSGDNPNSLIGLGLIRKGKAAISLGTSDTYFNYLKQLQLDYRGEGHVFGAPTGDYMSLICYKNGSLARERIKNRFDLEWEEFSALLKESPPGNEGKLMLPYFLPEIVPLVLNPKIHRYGLSEEDVKGNVRAIIEAQFLSMRLHSRWIKEEIEEIYATGGASANETILQVASDIFNIPIRTFEETDSAALGAALRSANSFYDSIGASKSWSELFSTFLNSLQARIIIPNRKVKTLYDEMVELYGKFEDHVLREGKNPEADRKKFIEKYFA